MRSKPDLKKLHIADLFVNSYVEGPEIDKKQFSEYLIKEREKSKKERKALPFNNNKKATYERNKWLSCYYNIHQFG